MIVYWLIIKDRFGIYIILLDWTKTNHDDKFI